MKKFDWFRINGELDSLRKKGYHVIVEKPWHWEVRKSGSRVLVHVWPSVQKYMVAYDREASFYRDNLLECVEKSFTPVAKLPALNEKEKKSVDTLKAFRDSFI